jgi:peptidase E
MTRTIVAIGGHGMNIKKEENLKIHNFILSSTSKRKPKVGFLGTATGDDMSYVARFYESFSSLDCQPSHLSLFDINHENYESYLLDQDIIYVGGGNTFNMLKIWSGWGVDKLLKKCYEQGVVLAGSSAGSICWFEGGNTDSFSQKDLYPIDGLGFLPYSHSPHYNSERNRRDSYHNLIQEGSLKPGYAMDDYAGILFVDEQVQKIFSAKEGASVYFVEKKDGVIVETSLKTVYLN